MTGIRRRLGSLLGPEGPQGPKGEKGNPGPEGPYGGTSVTDPQVASMVSADTATAAALKDGFIERHGTRGQTRTIYVRSTGDDSNDGAAGGVRMVSCFVCGVTQRAVV